jgi:colicin import membrane protein
MENDDPKVVEKFDPNIAELTAIVEATKNLTATDLEDKTQLALVKEKRIELKKTRVKIEKAGLAARDEANKFSKAVIAYEKKLVGIIEPEEDRLAAIEEEAEKIAFRKEQLEKLPARKERMVKNGLAFFCQKTDEELLELDAVAFEAFYNELGALKVQYDADQERMKREEAEKLLAEENAKKKAEQDAKEAELKAREDAVKAEEQRIAHEKEVEQAKKDTEARLKKEAEEKAAADKAAADKKAADEAAAKKAADAKLAKDKEYQAFLKGLGMTKTNVAEFHKIETATEIVVYKKIGSFKK